MIRRFALVVGGFAVVVLSFWLTLNMLSWWRDDDQGTGVEWSEGSGPCPIEVSDPVATALGPNFKRNRWTVYKFNGQGTAPDIRVRRDTSELPDAGTSAVCALRIVSAPQVPEKGLDWRIGNVTQGPAGLRGKRVTFQLRYKASAPVALDTGNFYVYDGKTVSGSPLTSATPDWRTVSIAHSVDPSAPVFEMWIRLVVDAGTIKPAGETIYFSASLEPAGP